MVRFSKTKTLDILKWVAGHTLPVILFLFLLSSILGVIMFYSYVFPTQQIEPEPEVVPVEFEAELYRDILEEERLRKEKFDSADYQEHPELFWPKAREID